MDSAQVPTSLGEVEAVGVFSGFPAYTCSPQVLRNKRLRLISPSFYEVQLLVLMCADYYSLYYNYTNLARPKESLRSRRLLHRSRDHQRDGKLPTAYLEVIPKM